MGEQPVVTHADAEAGDDPHGQQQHQFRRPERMHGEEGECGNGAEDGQNVEQEEVAALEPVHVGVADRLPARFLAGDTGVVFSGLNVVFGHLNLEGSGEHAFAQKLSDRGRFVPSR
ncbi:hypothetical protein AB0I53_41475 [Saccharopolyspora sp. NPDC050389]|uniref:hypothetical protein n=1 Tax=Saccharopolyspora sp. NPDC050389 TaxID=3155516 RepID=UPI0033FA2934